MTHTFKIKIGETTGDAKVELDGQKLKSVRRVSFVLNPNDLSVVMLEIMGEIEVDGEFKESAIIQVRQPALD